MGSELRYVFGNCILDADRRELRRENELVPIEPQVFDLLEFLIRNRERVVSRDDLFAAIWAGRTVSELALSTRINAARSAIGDTGEQQNLIKTLPRKGIRFVGTVREEKEQDVAIGPTSDGTAFALPDKPSIAVLPFTNMSGDPEQDYFADGMADEIITALSRCNWLFVIARNSSFTYKGKALDIRQIGRELGVRCVLEGSVRRAGNRLRFIAQLIDATTGAHIWADRFDGDMSDVSQALAGQNRRLVDLRGSAVIPGLSDNHDHLYNGEKVMRGIDLVGATSTDEVLRRLRNGLAKAKAGETVFGSVGWRAALARNDLDQISTDVPVVALRGRWGAAVMNSAALKKAGIAKEMQSYMGREIPKDSSEEMTGELPDFPAGLYAIDKVVPVPTPDEEDQWIAAGQTQRNALGITSTRDLSRKTRDGRVLGLHEKISREEALRIATYNNAFATWEEKVKGSIEPGKLADFLVLSGDFMTIPEDEILKLHPMATYVGGRKVYAAPEANGAF